MKKNVDHLINKPFTFDRVVRLSLGVLLVGLLVLLVWYLTDVLVPFAVAFLLAYLMNPLVELLQRLVRSRGLAVFLSLTLIGGLFVGFWFALSPLVGRQFTHMGELMQAAVERQHIDFSSEYFNETVWPAVQAYLQRPDIQQFFSSDKFSELSSGAAEKILPGVMGIFSGAMSVLVALFGLTIILLYLIFLMLDYPTIVDGWKSMIPPRFKGVVLDVVRDFEEAMSNYFRAQTLVAFLVGVLFAIGFTLIGLPMGILLGLFIGLLNMVPYLQTIGFIPAIFLAFIRSLEADAPSFAAMLGLVLLVFAVVQTIQDAILVPKIMGSVTGLNPAAILLALSIWGKLLGLLGLIIALPITYLILSYYRTLVIKPMEAEKRLPEHSATEHFGVMNPPRDL